MASKRELDRRLRVKTALDRVKPRETITNEELAEAWGVSPARWISVQKDIPKFPAHQKKDGNTKIFLARAALGAMWQSITQHDDAEEDRQARMQKLLGRPEGDDERVVFSPSELLKYNQLGAEVQAREVEQGRLVDRADVQATFADIASTLSEALGELDAACDPNGRWPADVRAAVKQAGRDQLVGLHAKLKGVISGDATLGPKGARGRRG